MEKLNIVKVLLSHVVNLDWLLHHFNVKNVFPYGDLKEEVYDSCPIGVSADSCSAGAPWLRK